MVRQSQEAEEDVEREEGGRRKSGYGHTAVQQIIIGFVRQHLLCQHSSRQPRGGRAKNRLQSSERHKERQKQGQTQEGKSLRSVWTLWSSGLYESECSA